MEGIAVNPSEATVKTTTSRGVVRPAEIQQIPKRTRSYVLKQMLEECRRVKKESMDAIEEIEAALVKPEPLSEEDEQGALRKDAVGHAEIPERSKGKQQKSGKGVQHGKKSYHAAVYRASFQTSSSQRNSGAKTMSDRVKGKRQVVGNSVEKSPKLQEDKANARPSRRGVGRANYRRSSTSAPVSVKEASWTRIVDNPEKLRKNALFIPRAVIRECIYGKIPRVTLIDRSNDVPYYCQMIKREGTVDRYLCGMWSDFCKDRNLQKGDTLRFSITYPPVESIVVAVERGKADGVSR
ncbi:uncharacterized protein LOC131605370 [Vicia villosa]|uniref:uncharacterized protein LOC131605370 n=1 Tax=Vicia villosa TaxID=3911 RepID=UPI00273C808D|nr:uncharacterized protein LOC131605370 [Vicia villosa]